MTESVVTLNTVGEFKEEKPSKSLVLDILRPRKKRSKWEDQGLSNNLGKFRTLRWGPESEKTFTPQAFSFIDYTKTPSEIEIIIRKHRLEDLQRRIAIGDYESNDPDIRSPSPEPEYDKKTGQRLNSHDIRSKEKYYKERNFIIDDLMKLDPTFMPPPDYKAQKIIKKIRIPDFATSGQNFAGLIIGYKGKTQKELERKSKCKICVRGKGAIMGKLYNRLDNDDSEPLHVRIEGDNEDNIKKAVDLLAPLLNIDQDQQTNEADKQEMIEWRAINDVLKDEICENCGGKGHKGYNCPFIYKDFQISSVCCNFCKSTSHTTVECPLAKSKPNNGQIMSYEDTRNMILSRKEENSMLDRTDNYKFKLSHEGRQAISEIEFQREKLKFQAENKDKILMLEAEAKMNAPYATTKFKGSDSTIKVEKIIMLNANGVVAGTELPEGSVLNPIMNPMTAAQFAPYISQYNNLIRNSNAYMQVRPTFQTSSMAGYPKLNPEEDNMNNF